MHRRLAGCCALLLLLTACTAAGRAPVRKDQPQAPSITTLKVAVCQQTDDQQVFDALIAAYQDAHPDMRVQQVGIPCDSPEAIKQLLVYTEYDLLPTNYMDSGGRPLIDLTPYLASHGVSEAPFGKLLEPVKRVGRVRALPLRIFPGMIWANKPFFVQAGLPLPDGGWSWDEFRTTAAALGAQRTDGSRIALAFDYPEQLVAFWLEERTGRPASETDPQTLGDALAYFQSLVLTDRTIEKPPERDPHMTYSSPPAEFWAGKAPLGFDAVRSIPELVGKLSNGSLALLPMPTHPGTHPVTMGHITYYGVADKSAQPDAAFNFLAFAAGPAGAAAVARAGYFPAVPTDAVGEIWADWSPPLPPAVQTLLDTRLIMEHSDQTAALDRLIAALANRVMRGDATAADAVTEFSQRAKSLRGH